MSLRVALVGPIGILIAIGAASAQDRPNFAGRWVLTSPLASAGQEETVTQDAATLTTSHASEGLHGHRTVYKLDGTENRNVLVLHGEDVVTISKASWTGNALTITSDTTYPDKRTRMTKAVWTLDGEGHRVVDFTEAWDGGTPQTARHVYRRR